MAEQDLSQLKIDKATAVYRPARRKRLWYVGIAAIAVIAVIVLALNGVFSPAVKVETAHVTLMYPSQGFTVLNASGYVVAQRRAAVASKVTGRLISLSVEEGSRVKTGQVIARLENDDLLASRDQAAANLDAARQNFVQAKAELHEATVSFNRNKELLAHGYISQAEYDVSEARHKKAIAAVAAADASVSAGEAAFRGAEIAHDYTLIRAPFDAVVLTKNADVGDIVTPIGAAADAKAAVVTIADMDSLLVEVDVSESNIQMVNNGQPCEIQLDALPDVRFSGKVHMIVPTADRTKATIMVKIGFTDKDSRVLPEMSAKVAFLSREVNPGEEKPLAAVASSAIVSRNGKSTVYVLREKRAVEVVVAVGKQLGDMTEIVEGVNPGDAVVLRPPGTMKDGVKVRVSEK